MRLILVYKFLNSIILITFLPIQIVLFSIDNNHGMFDSSDNFIRIKFSASYGHVCDKIRDLTHFHAFIKAVANHSIAAFACATLCIRISRILITWIEINQFINSFGCFKVLSFCRNNKNCIAITVCTGKLSSGFRINTYCMFRILAKFINAFLIIIVDSKPRNLKSTSMRMTNQNHFFAVFIHRSIDFMIAKRIYRHKSLRALSREACTFQVDSCRITF